MLRPPRVMAGLVPAISMRGAPYSPARDRRDKPGDDTESEATTQFVMAGLAALQYEPHMFRSTFIVPLIVGGAQFMHQFDGAVIATAPRLPGGDGHLEYRDPDSARMVRCTLPSPFRGTSSMNSIRVGRL